jgi:hypothetical protein
MPTTPAHRLPPVLAPLSSLSTPVASLLRARAARAERRRLQADLDSYRTPSERAELDAILSRHTEAELDELAELTGRRRRAA